MTETAPVPSETPADAFRDLLGAAVTHHESGRLQAAEPLYRRLLEAQPDHPDLHHLLGVLCYQQGRVADAIPELERAVALDGADPSYRSNLGNAYLANERFDDAERAYRAALAIDPGFADARLNLGRALQLRGRFEEAEREYREVVRQHPGAAQANNNLGTLYKQRGETEQAIACFRQALKSIPDYRDAQINLAAALMSMGRWDEAESAYRRARALAPEDRTLALTHADLLKRQGRLDEALEILEPVVRATPNDFDAHILLGLLLQDAGEFERARQAYQTVLEADPNHQEALNNLGTVLQATDSLEQAIEVYKRAVAINPSFVEALCNLGYAYHQMGAPGQAIETLERARAANPGHDAACSRLTMLYYADKQLDKVREVLREWLAKTPDSPIANHMLAAYTGERVPGRAADEYVENTFDRFAEEFDLKLSRLGYRAPEYIAEALAEQRREPSADDDILDAGCGTGLCGPLIRSHARRLVGVDLSEKMLEKARPRRVYDALEKAELTGYLERHAQAFDVVVSADTLVYFGELGPVFAASHDALRSGGLLIFTVEAMAPGDGSGYRINPSGRYSHSRDYVVDELERAGLSLVALREVVLRYEGKEPVHGLLVTARRNGSNEEET